MYEPSAAFTIGGLLSFVLISFLFSSKNLRYIEVLRMIMRFTPLDFRGTDVISRKVISSCRHYCDFYLLTDKV